MHGGSKHFVTRLGVGLALASLPLAVPVLVTGGAGDDGEPEPMTAILARLAEESRGLLDSRRRAARLKEQIRNTEDVHLRAGLVYRLGRELLRAGDTEEAITTFLDIRRFFSREQVRVNPTLARELTEQLAIAYLRLGEQDNCIALHGGGSCIIPLDPEARHRVEKGSRQAMEELQSLLTSELDPSHIWLLNLAAMTLGEYPDGVREAWRLPPEVFDSEGELVRFVDRAPALGLDILGTSGGSVVEDFDGDGLLDVMASAWGLDEQLRLHINAGDGRFVERTAEAGLRGQTGGLNLVHADYDDDGDADVLVLRGAWLSVHGRHPNSLLRNDGDGSFTDVTRKAGLLSFHPTQTADWADFDGDGDLDLFIGNESDERQKSPCELYANDGDGTFTETAAAVGLDVEGFVKGVAWGDVDNDGRPDLFLSRFGQPNLLFHNDGPTEKGEGPAAWRFTDITVHAGVTEPVRSFPTWFWDFDNDGWLDLLVASYSGFTTESLGLVVADYLGRKTAGETPRLYRNQGDGTFEDVTRRTHLDRVLLAMGSNYGDLDNDGYPDAYFGTGEPAFETLVPNRMFRNDAGRRFLDVTTAGGFGHLQKGHAVSFADVDNDGDQDVHEVLGGAYSGDVYQNVLFVNPGTESHWVTLKLVGTDSPRSALGARLRVVVTTPDGERTVHAVVDTGGSFGSNPLRAEIGLGRAGSIERVEIDWPSGRHELVEGLALDAFYRITEAEGKAERLRPPRVDLSARPLPRPDHHAGRGSR